MEKFIRLKARDCSTEVFISVSKIIGICYYEEEQCYGVECVDDTYYLIAGDIDDVVYALNKCF